MDQIYFAATDLTGVTVTIRACVEAGDANSIFQSFVQDGAPNYFGDYAAGPYKAFSTISKCSVGLQDISYVIATAGTFDATMVTSFTVSIFRNGTTGPWIDSTLYIDSITFSGGTGPGPFPGPYSFTTSASPLTPNPGPAPTWIP